MSGMTVTGIYSTGHPQESGAFRWNSGDYFFVNSMRDIHLGQLVLSGDFCQLPPVPDADQGVPIPATFAFDAKSWNLCVGKPIVLQKVFRQKDQSASW